MENELEEDRAFSRTTRPSASLDHGTRKSSLVPVRGIGMQHGLLPVEEEANEAPESEEIAELRQPATPGLVVHPPKLLRLPPTPNTARRRVLSESDTGTPDSPSTQKASPSEDRLRSPRLSVTLALLNKMQEPRQHANQMHNAQTITATTGARHLKELQRNIRQQTSQTNMYLASIVNAHKQLGTPDRRTHHPSGGHLHAKPDEQPTASPAGMKHLDPKMTTYHTWHPQSPHARPRNTPKSSHPSGLAKSDAQRSDEKPEHLKFEHPPPQTVMSRLLSKFHLRNSATDQGVHV